MNYGVIKLIIIIMMIIIIMIIFLDMTFILLLNIYIYTYSLRPYGLFHEQSPKEWVTGEYVAALISEISTTPQCGISSHGENKRHEHKRRQFYEANRPS